jgi:hypothetical protein
MARADAPLARAVVHCVRVGVREPDATTRHPAASRSSNTHAVRSLTDGVEQRKGRNTTGTDNCV